jgi:hypothetical protein
MKMHTTAWIRVFFILDFEKALFFIEPLTIQRYIAAISDLRYPRLSA